MLNKKIYFTFGDCLLEATKTRLKEHFTFIATDWEDFRLKKI